MVRGGIFLRIAGMFLAVLIVPVSVILFSMNTAFQQNDMQEILRSQRYSMAQVQSNFQRFFDYIDQTIMDIIYSREIQSSLLGQATLPEIQSVLSSKAYKDAMFYAYVDNRGNTYFSDNVYVPRGDLVEALDLSSIYTSMISTYAELRWQMDESGLLSARFIGREKTSLFAGRMARHLDINAPPGCIVAQISAAQIATLISDPLMRTDTRYLLLDEEGAVVTDSHGEYGIGERLDAPLLLAEASAAEDNHYGELELGKQFYVFGRMRDEGLTLVSCLPEASVLASRNTLNQLLLRVSLVSSGIALLLALLFSLYFSRPVNAIVRGMRRVRKGDFSVRVPVKRRGEIGELTYSFNKMTQDMEKLIARTKRDEQELRNAEINALVYQINPHFLYNTLDNINMLSRRGGDERIGILITELSSLLRITLSGGRDVIPVRSEMQHVGNYLHIMQMRSGDLFSYALDCEEAAGEMPVMKFILQPLAENAISHGLKYMDEDGRIDIRAALEGGALVFTVADNGMGMEEDDRRALEAHIRKAPEEQEKTEGGVGLANVYRRLRIFYSEQGFAMQFRPSALGGLEIEVKIFL